MQSLTDAAISAVGGRATSASNPTELGLSVVLDEAILPCQRPAQMDLWFAERASDIERAKALCGPCPLRAECLAGALRRAEPWGVWGGEVFVDGVAVAHKRGRGRPRKTEAAA